MSQHTPGPWKAVKTIVNIPRMVIVPHTPINGYQVSRTSSLTAHLADEAEANARLIAKAPELLKVLRGVLPYAETECSQLWELHRHDGDEQVKEEAEEAVEAVRAAQELLKSLAAESPTPQSRK